MICELNAPASPRSPVTSRIADASSTSRCSCRIGRLRDVVGGLGRLARHPPDRVRVRAQRLDALLGPAQARGGDHLHRARDLADVLDRRDAAPDVLQVRHVARSPAPAPLVLLLLLAPRRTRRRPRRRRRRPRRSGPRCSRSSSDLSGRTRPPRAGGPPRRGRSRSRRSPRRSPRRAPPRSRRPSRPRRSSHQVAAARRAARSSRKLRGTRWTRSTLMRSR